MTERITTEPHWKVWVAVRGGILHLASRTQPQVHPDFGERIGDVTADWMPGPNGIPAYIDWTKVTAVTWRHDTERAAAYRSWPDLTDGGGNGKASVVERKARDVSERTAEVIAYVESIGYAVPVAEIADKFPQIKRNSLHKLLRRAAGRGQVSNPLHGRYGPARTTESSR